MTGRLLEDCGGHVIASLYLRVSPCNIAAYEMKSAWVCTFDVLPGGISIDVGISLLDIRESISR